MQLIMSRSATFEGFWTQMTALFNSSSCMEWELPITTGQDKMTRVEFTIRVSSLALLQLQVSLLGHFKFQNGKLYKKFSRQ